MEASRLSVRNGRNERPTSTFGRSIGRYIVSSIDSMPRASSDVSIESATDYEALESDTPPPTTTAPRRRAALLVALVSSAALLCLATTAAVQSWRRPQLPGDSEADALLRQLRTLFEERPEDAPQVMPVLRPASAPPDDRAATAAFRSNPAALSSAATATAHAAGSSFHSRMPTTALAEKPPQGRFDDLVPVVFLHGMGDAGSNPGMQSLCKTATDAYPGLYVVCANVANGLASITTPLAEQVEEFSQFVKSDQRLSDGFHAVGLSQGGLVLRGYVETKNEPLVKKFVSVCAPQGGVGSCPSNQLYKMVRAREQRPARRSAFYNSSSLAAAAAALSHTQGVRARLSVPTYRCAHCGSSRRTPPASRSPTTGRTRAIRRPIWSGRDGSRT
jgi:hypothetical protein